jgi:multidrug efflux pump subunit AcrA (membrane-fusion protein)
MKKLIRKNRLIAVILILVAVISAAALGTGFYDLFITTVNAQGPGGGNGRVFSPDAKNEIESETAEVIAVEVTEVKKGDFFIYTTVSADSEAFEEVMLTPRIQEIVTEVAVSLGDSVQAGDNLIKLDSRSNQISVIQAEASLKSAKANLQKALNSPREEEVSRLEAQLKQAESELKLRRENYERQKELFEEGYLSQEEIDQANNQRIAAESSYHSVLKNLELTEAGATEEEIAQLEAQVTQAEASLESSKLRMSYTEINTPITGIVSELNARRGQLLSGGTAVVVSNINKIKLTAYVSENNINKLEIGDQVLADFTAIKSDFTGEIKSISPRTAASRRSFPVEIIVENPDQIIKAGMTSQVSIPIERAADSIIIPQNALLEDSSAFYTFVVADGKVERRDLEISLENENNAVVSSGLKVGEKVVTLGKESLSDGDSINVVNRGDNK